MQVLEVVITRAHKTDHFNDGWSMSPSDSVRPARIVTRTVLDRRLVGSKIIEGLKSFGVSVDWYACGQLKIELSWHKSIWLTTWQVVRIIDSHKNVVRSTGIRASM